MPGVSGGGAAPLAKVKALLGAFGAFGRGWLWLGAPVSRQGRRAGRTCLSIRTPLHLVTLGSVPSARRRAWPSPWKGNLTHPTRSCHAPTLHRDGAGGDEPTEVPAVPSSKRWMLMMLMKFWSQP